MNKNYPKTLGSLNIVSGCRGTRSAWTAVACLAAMLCGCGTTSLKQRANPAAILPSPPTLIYVADFELDASRITSGPGGILPLKSPPSPFGSEFPKGPWTSKDPSTQATLWVETMSEALVRELKSAGLAAQRLEPSTHRPTSGWLLRGAITKVDPGHQLKRAVIGFGEGKTELQVVVHLEELRTGSHAPIAGWDTSADSGKAPGAGPMLVLGPGVLAVRMVAAGQDLRNNIRQTATMIAAEVRTRAQGCAQPL